MGDDFIHSASKHNFELHMKIYCTIHKHVPPWKGSAAGMQSRWSKNQFHLSKKDIDMEKYVEDGSREYCEEEM